MVVTKGEVGLGGIVLVDDSVPVLESLEACCKLFDVLICLVKSGGVVGELKVVSTDGGSA